MGGSSAHSGSSGGGGASLTMICMLSAPYAKFWTLNAARSVICGGATHVESCACRIVDDGAGGGTIVMMSVTVGIGPVIVTVGDGT